VILALGAADRLVARTQFDTDRRLAALPAIDQALMPSVEWLIEQRPDLVLAWPDRQSRTIVTRLAELGIPVYASRVETLGELKESVKDIGALIGRQNAADSIVADLDSAIAQVRAMTSPLEKRSVLYLIGLDPPMAAGPLTFVDEMIRIAGGTNVMSDAVPRWPQVSVEEIVARNPDVVFLATSDTADPRALRGFERAPGFRRLRAVEQKRVLLVDANLFNRPGPALSDAMRRLAMMIHPELQN
jgi:iron complex transport system substrate-binding protein